MGKVFDFESGEELTQAEIDALPVVEFDDKVPRALGHANLVAAPDDYSDQLGALHKRRIGGVESRVLHNFFDTHGSIS